MDSNHPIPQDVTGFQFRLIGDMTVKQFAYVAVGGIFAVIALYFPIPVLIRIPFILLFAGAGLAVAFFPVEGRPMDLMLANFFKALLSPNQYVYHKTGGALMIFALSRASTPQRLPSSFTQVRPMADATDKAKKQKLEQYLTSIHSQNLSPVEKREAEFVQKILPQAVPTPQNISQTPPVGAGTTFLSPKFQQNLIGLLPKSKLPPIRNQERDDEQKMGDGQAETSSEEQKNTTLALQENVLSQELTHAKQEEATQTDQLKKQQVHSHVTSLEQQLQEIKQQKETLEKELLTLKATLSPQPSPVTPVPTQEPPSQQPPSVQPVVQQPGPEAAIRKIPAEFAKSLGLPHLPDVPNLIIGIVKDPRGNVLSNILVEVKDKDGTPARAFRTNQLGQFASATPLTNGAYSIEFEDPKGQHQFDLVEINADGEILMPIEVISHDEREELRKALFN